MGLLDLAALAAITLCVLGFVVDADNGVDRISEQCLGCLRKVQPHQDKECIAHKTLADTEQCGPFKMTPDFYYDCNLTANFPERDPNWSTFEGCYASEECSRICVEHYHNFYADMCSALMPDPHAPLTCADYAQMHFGGFNSCGKPEYRENVILREMNFLCGCVVVYEDREKCMNMVEPGGAKEPGADSGSGVSPEGERYQQIVIIVLGVCCCILMVAVIAVAMYCHRKNRRLLITSHLDARTKVMSIKDFKPTGQSTKSITTVTANPMSQRSASSHGYVNRPPSVDELRMVHQTQPSKGLYGLVLDNKDASELSPHVLTGLQLTDSSTDDFEQTQNSTPSINMDGYETAVPVNPDNDQPFRDRLDSLNRGGASPGSSLPDISIASDDIFSPKTSIGYINVRELSQSTNSLSKQVRQPIPTPRESNEFI